jgi:hypothetical protein
MIITGAVTLSHGVAVQDQPLVITCTVTPSITGGVTFEHPPGSTVGSCFIPLFGLPCTSSLYGDTNLTQDVTAGTTSLSILQVDKSRDDGDWRCIYTEDGTNVPSTSETIDAHGKIYHVYILGF